MVSFADDVPRPRGWTDSELCCYKYVDDFIGVEKLFTGAGLHTFSQNKTKIAVRAKRSENFYNVVTTNANQIGMRVNLKKTQMLTISAALHSDVESYVKIDQTIIHSQNTLKILGFQFGSRPDIGVQVETMSRKFRRRVWILRHLKKASIPQIHLVKLYLSLVLPVLDYTSVVYHSMLSLTQEAELENLQKLALKVIYGVTGISYVQLLEWAGIGTLKERRLRLIDKFLAKTLKHPTYKNWFPTRNFVHHDLRSERVYEEKYARTKRLYQSPFYFYRRRLNSIAISSK